MTPLSKHTHNTHRSRTLIPILTPTPQAPDPDDDDEEDDDLQEIETDNILATGRRTRGKAIDFAKAAEEAGPDDEDDEDDDEDFEAPDDDEMKD